jgi:hypothetical protein
MMVAMMMVVLLLLMVVVVVFAVAFHAAFVPDACAGVLVVSVVVVADVTDVAATAVGDAATTVDAPFVSVKQSSVPFAWVVETALENYQTWIHHYPDHWHAPRPPVFSSSSSSLIAAGQDTTKAVDALEADGGDVVVVVALGRMAHYGSKKHHVIHKVVAAEEVEHEACSARMTSLHDDSSQYFHC